MTECPIEQGLVVFSEKEDYTENEGSGYSNKDRIADKAIGIPQRPPEVGEESDDHK